MKGSDLSCEEQNQPGLGAEEEGLPAQTHEKMFVFKDADLSWDRLTSLRHDAVVWEADFGEAGPLLPLGPGGPLGPFHVVAPLVRLPCFAECNCAADGLNGKR
jgi:hypothetical protein